MRPPRVSVAGVTVKVHGACLCEYMSTLHEFVKSPLSLYSALILSLSQTNYTDQTCYFMCLQKSPYFQATLDIMGMWNG
jgi:hypothetical protein